MVSSEYVEAPSCEHTLRRPRVSSRSWSGDSVAPILRTYEFVGARLRSRLEGLTDGEYFWEPVPGSWSVRRDDDDTWTIDGYDGGLGSDPAPLTTIAWRVVHLGGGALGGFTGLRFGDGWPDLLADLPRSAARARDYVDEKLDGWVGALRALDETGWTSPLGEAWGEYADDSTIDLALHVLDELIHHGAEVALLRDLYRTRS